MGQTTEGASEIVEGVRFSFMTDEEVRKQSVLKITNPILLDSVGRPMPGGLYDPLLGPMDMQAPCKSCGQQSFDCPGHCGHIDLVSPVYNPLLFDMLFNLLRRTCFICRHFRAGTEEVETCTSKLTMIAKGDVIGAKNYVNNTDSKDIDMEESDGSHVSSSTLLSRSQSESPGTKQEFWTSVQYMEAKSVLKEFLNKTSKSCKQCGSKNPKITKPTFGSFRMEMTTADAGKNYISGYQLGSTRDEEEVIHGDDDKTSEVTNVNEQFEDDRVDTAGTSSSPATSSKRNVKKKKSKVPSDFKELKDRYSGSLLPSRVIDIIKDLWENETGLCSYICDMQHEQFAGSFKSTSYSMFFIEALLVPPTKFRPAAVAGDSVMENPQTVLLGKVVQSNIALGNAHINKLEGSKIADRWRDLQQSVNVLFDSKTATSQNLKNVNTGICQLLEKKEGIFRQKMMGKRVNYACRSVISPDPYLAVNEIGVPPYFALRLTYPERVTPWNVVKLRNAIINGSDIHPGATHYADKVSTVRLPQKKNMRISISRKLPSSRGMAIQSKKISGYEFEGKVVYRHLQDGDIVLVNRQPTLHKPSIMAHVVRVLKGEKTLRMHYANCSSYNADFDGDEMNVHLPQDEISRAEAYNIVNANNQYIVPTRGDTVRGLIQDHIVSSVLLTMKDTFLNREDFNQLLYASGVYLGGSSRGKISTADKACFVEPVIPAVLKPKPLWTGKQVITAILNHLTRGYTPCIVDNKVKIPEQYFEGKEVKHDKNKTNKRLRKELAEFKNATLKEVDETKLLIWKNELVCGVIDKAQFGKYGLVHTVQELYGPDVAGLLLGAFSRLFTSFLQFHGFTCGLDDLMVSPDCDKEMKMELEGEDIGEKVHRKFVNLENQKTGTRELQLETEKIIRGNGVTATASLDNLMQTELRDKGSMISKKWLPKGLLKPFPQNCISLMTISGAKGSSVNFQQISFLLGQQELEGKRVPRMVSGKTLPSFPPWDFTSRAGGYIIDRFLTGLRPQEYYFHCMAGREGLVDTAVKTSRSGYLQRCLIKNLESLKVSYDYTVRDADGSIVQFYYGEDGVDVHQTSFLNNVEVLRANREIVCQKLNQPLEFNSYIQELPEGIEGKIQSYKQKITKKNREDLLMLIRQKYLSSLAQPGEPVGVLAGQSVGEPSTQMTLNTFHLAGRGEMNVTLGIPRLQEILMTAAANIKTPIITCPLLVGRSMKDAEKLVEKVKKLTVAELVQSIEVSKSPHVIHNNQPCRLYKLKVRLKQPRHVSLHNCQETLRNVFLRALEDAIERHVALLSRINGIKSVRKTKASESGEDDASMNNVEHDDNDDDDGDDDDNDKDETAEDLGSEFNKRKRQSTDSVEYEDGSEEDGEEEDASSDLENGGDDGKVGTENESDDETDGEHLTEKQQQEEEDTDIEKAKSSEGFVERKFDRATFVEVKGLNLEVHFMFTNEPDILLAEVAQKAAKKVYIKGSGKLEQCQPVKYSVNVKQVCWNQNQSEINKMKEKIKNSNENKKKEDDDEYLPCALQASGVELPAFWDMEDDLDVDHVYSNNIYTMLNTYGVEAARTSIILEMKNVFGSYGVEIDYRHLSLIADHMTHSGGYRPMSRFGSISESVSPFLKMSFETASKFIVEAASHGLKDDLETPTARICLGLPVKVGTGCMELMQKLDI